MNELSFFTGGGGGLLGSCLMGWRVIGYVEKDSYCKRIIEARIKDGHLDAAPVFDDVVLFNSEGYAQAYQGMVDVFTAGFPCQPFSSAGKQLGEDDPRNMWPATVNAIRIIRPSVAYLENVPGILSQGQKLVIIALEKIRQLDIFGAANSKSLSGRFTRHIIKVTGGRYIGRILGDLAEIGYDARWCVLGADNVGARHRRKRWCLMAYPSVR